MKKFQKVRLVKKQINNQETNYKENYWSEGKLLADIEVGAPIALERYKRSDYRDYNKEIAVIGLFLSSSVKEINGNIITTENSIWEVIELNESI